MDGNTYGGQYHASPHLPLRGFLSPWERGKTDTRMAELSAVERAKLLSLPLAELVARADRVRREQAGSQLDLCTISNAKSGRCREDCRFCAQSSHYTTDTPVWPLKPVRELVGEAAAARAGGAQRFGIVTSGHRLSDDEFSRVVEAVAAIHAQVNIIVCASLGALSESQFRTLRAAGLVRYHHNLETSERFYPQVATTHSWQERVATVRAAKAAGLEVCSGCILGLGETWDDRFALAETLRDLAVDAVPLNLLVGIPGTPLANRLPIACAEAIRAIAIFRLILGKATVKLAAGRELILRDFQGLAFQAGANGMLIGGYLTVRGRAAADDLKLAEEIKTLWTT